MGDPNLTQIQKLQSRPDPQLNFKWVAEQSKLPFGLPSTYLEGIDISFNNIKVQEAIYGGSGYSYYPGTHDISAFSIQLYEDHEGNALRWILYWKSKIKSFKTGAYGLPGAYKQPLSILLLDTKNNPVTRIKLTGVWPSETSNYQLNYTDSGRIIVSQSMSVDSQEISFLKNSSVLPSDVPFSF